MSTYNPDFKLNSQELLYALFNHENGLALTPETLRFSTPKVGRSSYDTTVVATMPHATCDINSATIRYKRIELPKLFSKIKCSLLSSNFTDGKIDIESIKAEMLSQYGFNISSGFTVIKEDNGTYKLVSDKHNLSYVGDIVINLIPTLRERVQLTLLDGFKITKLTPIFKFKIGTWRTHARSYVGYNDDPNWADNGGKIDDENVWQVDEQTLVALKSIRIDQTFKHLNFRSKTGQKWNNLDSLTLTLIDDNGDFISIPTVYKTFISDVNGYVETYKSKEDGQYIVDWLLEHEHQYVSVDIS